MTALVLRAAAHVHGHIGWLAAPALAHPALLLRNPRRRASTACFAATLLVTAAGALGAVLYPSYRVAIKPALFAANHVAALSFERKEHFGVAVVVLAWVGLVAHRAARPGTGERELARVAFVAYAAAAMLAAVTVVLGTFVAVEHGF